MSVVILPEILTAVDVAKQLRCHPETIMREARAGRLGFTRVGRLVRFTPEHVRRYIEEQERAACPSNGPGRSASTGSVKTGTAPGAARGSTGRHDKRAALALAQTILRAQ